MTGSNKYGYIGKIARVDLGTRNVTHELPDEQLLKTYIGGTGL